MDLATANSGLALLGALVLTGVVSRMDRATCHSVRIALVLVFAGFMGDFLSLWLKGWDQWVTTALYVGLILFIIADRRFGGQVLRNRRAKS
jgi:hypothetical protein